MMNFKNSQNLPPNTDLLDLIKDQSFAIIERDGMVSLFIGELYEYKTLEEFDNAVQKNAKPTAFALPFRMIKERGFEAKGNEPLLAIISDTIYQAEMSEFRAILPEDPIILSDDIKTSMNDTDYADMISTFQRDEIEGGHCSQTTLARKFQGEIHAYELNHVLSLYRTILFPQGQYMTILFCDRRENPDTPACIIGATPERHLTVTEEHALMIPIAGTLRKEDQESFPKRLETFIHDPKEINELFQVVDEELKMMGRICPEGGVIRGPQLREIGSVVHSEYELYGNRGLEPIDALRLTLHAPTVVGGPMESAARIISKYEPTSRRYYGGEIGVYQPGSAAASGKAELDCAIALRCAEIFPNGNFTIQAGGGLVRDSNPLDEARESRAKAMGMMAFLLNEPNTTARYLTTELQEKISVPFKARNDHLSNFWIENQEALWKAKVTNQPHKDIIIINNEDDFAYMIAHACRGLGYNVQVHDTFDIDNDLLKDKLIILGPGPGDPNDLHHPRMKKLHALTQYILGQKLPCLGICLGHQVLSVNIGIHVQKQTSSSQGMQREVSVLGKQHKLGFYNSFSPVRNEKNDISNNLDIDLDDQDRIIAMKADHFIGFQFHPESIMSETGLDLLQEALAEIERYAAEEERAA